MSKLNIKKSLKPLSTISEINKKTFLNIVEYNSLILLNDFLYLWRPDLGESGFLISTDNDSPDIPFNNIEFSKIQDIKNTKNVWSKKNYDFDMDFIDEVHYFYDLSIS